MCKCGRCRCRRDAGNLVLLLFLFFCFSFFGGVCVSEYLLYIHTRADLCGSVWKERKEGRHCFAREHVSVVINFQWYFFFTVRMASMGLFVFFFFFVLVGVCSYSYC
jgi:hypothetical protein